MKKLFRYHEVNFVNVAAPVYRINVKAKKKNKNIKKWVEKIKKTGLKSLYGVIRSANTLRFFFTRVFSSNSDASYMYKWFFLYFFFSSSPKLRQVPGSVDSFSKSRLIFRKNDFFSSVIRRKSGSEIANSSLSVFFKLFFWFKYEDFPIRSISIDSRINSSMPLRKLVHEIPIFSVR